MLIFTVKREPSFNLKVLIKYSIAFNLPASITNSNNKPKPGSDVTPSNKETLDFDHDTSKGNDSCYPLTRIRCWSGKLFNVNLYS